MACRLFVAEPLSDPTWWFLSTKCISNAGNLSRLQCVKQSVCVKKLGCRVFFDLGYHCVDYILKSIFWMKIFQFSVVSRRYEGLVWVNAQRSDYSGSPLHTWVAIVALPIIRMEWNTSYFMHRYRRWWTNSTVLLAVKRSTWMLADTWNIHWQKGFLTTLQRYYRNKVAFFLEENGQNE